MRWKQLKNVPVVSCRDLVTFRGRFYASFPSGAPLVTDPYSLDATLLIHLQPLEIIKYLVPCGHDELFLAELILPRTGVVDFSRLTYRVSRLDEEARKWVVVTDLGDRVLFINRKHLGNVCCSAKELPDGGGVSGNSIVAYTFEYGGRAEDDLNCWRVVRDESVKILSKSPAVALRVERTMP